MDLSPLRVSRAGEQVYTIANPSYDGVFKYLLEDVEAARLMISTITGELVLSLEQGPQEYVEITVTDEKNNKFVLKRYDYMAKIETEKGQRTVLIEIQKKRAIAEVARFQQYVGKVFSNPQNKIEIEVPGGKRITVREIYCIYFVGTCVEDKQYPIIGIQSQPNESTKDVIVHGHDFFGALHPRSWTVQLSRLRNFPETESDWMLRLFDKRYCTDNEHFMEVPAADIPEKFHPLLWRLAKAAANERVREQMDNEDLYEMFLEVDRFNAEAKGREIGIEIGREEGIEIGIEKGRDEMKAEMEVTTVLNAHKEGLPTETIAKISGLTPTEISNIINQITTNI